LTLVNVKRKAKPTCSSSPVRTPHVSVLMFSKATYLSTYLLTTAE